MAQLYEQTGDGARATSLYREVVKMNPPYDIEFNARINIAGVFDINSGNPQEIRRELEKMLKDSKNKDSKKDKPVGRADMGAGTVVINDGAGI